MYTTKRIVHFRWRFCFALHRKQFYGMERDSANCGGRYGSRETRWYPIDLLLGTRDHTFYMLYFYMKNEQGELMAVQRKVLARLVREEFR